jgi:hypothetical protein
MLVVQVVTELHHQSQELQSLAVAAAVAGAVMEPQRLVVQVVAVTEHCIHRAILVKTVLQILAVAEVLHTPQLQAQVVQELLFLDT